MSSRQPQPASARCEIVRCGGGIDFTVEHPQRGPVDVCGYHARQIDDAFDGVEVTL